MSIDERIAREVMGYKLGESALAYKALPDMWYTADGYYTGTGTDKWHPSTSIEQAFMAVEKMATADGFELIYMPDNFEADTWEARMYFSESSFRYGYGKTAPEAIAAAIISVLDGDSRDE